VVVVAAAWLAAHLAVVGAHRYLAWDEAVYLAKASPGLRDVAWGPARALGFPALLYPVTVAGGGVLAIRVELMVVCSVGLVAAYWPWATVMGSAAPAAALLFASSWPALFFVSELYPNLVVAIALVGAFGAVIASIDHPRASSFAVAAFTFMTVASCVRPTDALFAVVAALPIVIVRYGRRAAASCVATAAGLLVGWSVWVVEAFVDFNGPLERFRAAFDNGSAREPRGRLLTGMAQLPIASTLRTPRVYAVVLWLALVVLLAVVGALVARRGAQLAMVLPVMVAGVVLAGAYGIFAPDTRTRFLLPSLALVTLPAGIGLQHAVYGLRSPAKLARLAAVVVCAAVVCSVVVHANAARAMADRERARRAANEAAGQVLAKVAAGRPCRFVAQFEYPVIEVASGCDGTPLSYDERVQLPRAFRRPHRGSVRFAVGPSPPAAGSLISRWELVRIGGVPATAVWLAPEARREGTSARTPPG
jgi:hypothetical protein